MHGPIDALEARRPAESWSTSASRTTGTLLFFCPDVTDASTLKRVQQFIDQGYDVTVFGFRRQRYNMGYEPGWPHVALGQTADGKYWHRLRALLGAVPAIVRQRRMLATASVFYARNIDQLLLALLARVVAWSGAPVAYEVLDIPPILTARGWRPAVVRLVERLCLRRTHLLILSSPGFHRAYYAPVQKYEGPWFLLENKLHPSIVGSGKRPAPPPRGCDDAPHRTRPWVVGYFGLIRGEETFDLMTRLADRLQGHVVFKFRGVLTTVDAAKFEAALRQRPNMVYGGPYLPQQDLEVLYRDVDFAWALDLEHTDHNSRWLLPCRFYEAGYFGVPCLTVRGFEVGTLVERHRIGWTFDAPLEESLARFFERMTLAEYQRTRDRLRAAPADMFVADCDVARLSSLLNAHPPSPPKRARGG